jgi:hypothetical protein
MHEPYLRPFVLRCSNCSAPCESGQSRCAFCSVPLTWEPRESLGRDDYWMHSLAREVNDARDTSDEDRGVGEFPLGPGTVHGGESHVFQLQPQEVFRVTHVWIHPRIADHFNVLSVRIGRDEVLMTRSSIGVRGGQAPGDAPGKISALRFSKGRGFPISSLDSCTLTPSIIMSVTVENALPRSLDFQGSVRGTRLDALSPSSLPGGGLRMASPPYSTSHPVDRFGTPSYRYEPWGPRIVGLRGSKGS